MLFFCSDLSQFTPKIQKFEAFGGVQVQPLTLLLGGNESI
jgi:hypothetical protein